MSTASSSKPEPVFSKRRIGIASLAAMLGCAACCALPLVLAAGVGGSAAAELSWLVAPGAELWVGGGVFLAVLGVVAVRKRARRSVTTGCSSSCDADKSCCAKGASSGIT